MSLNFWNTIKDISKIIFIASLLSLIPRRTYYTPLYSLIICVVAAAIYVLGEYMIRRIQDRGYDDHDTN